ncbi:uncharacterized protein CELE_F55C9.5 [Caenorhabditis elegans]|uniref:Uncharacterized protein n=1 Tax=Caenorhabditis elegans TaxID=6239 RepID=Q9XUZ0_CAEEL|nr:Uncharacterized protein CELE_F55C9.5 [Caenorhabditis elegans]CAB04472.1 Uncharacterized protein CELE_F55C9.5 [Caenorhabditis elegans]|eukprot:NP_507754.1 Uncharacterized protein CELE_F55C9.5 [Caenorhabditis elegans]
MGNNTIGARKSTTSKFWKCRSCIASRTTESRNNSIIQQRRNFIIRTKKEIPFPKRGASKDSCGSCHNQKNLIVCHLFLFKNHKKLFF